jgi:hypothetical protein
MFLRRDCLRIGALSALGFELGDWFTLKRCGGAAFNSSAKSCILLWLDGGPSHLETFDVKPDAPAEVRGPFRAIQTNVSGISICEHLPLTAQQCDKLTILRSVTSPLGEHGLAHHYLMTGYHPTPVIEYPSFGSVTARMRSVDSSLPKYITIPDARSGGSGYLGREYEPFAVAGDLTKPSARVRDLVMHDTLSDERLLRRRQYLKSIEEQHRFSERRENAIDPNMEQAFQLVTTPSARRAFELNQEPEQSRERYGMNQFGQSCLLARRLVESGVPFVTVSQLGWDTHDNLLLPLRDGYSGAKVGVGLLPTLDRAFSSLIKDLADRGMLEETLVVMMGEFGRTPKLNTRGGRDHWPGVFSVVMAGGGVRGGQTLGSSDATGERPVDQPISPSDIAYSIYTALGIDPNATLTTPDGRPIAINRDGGLIDGLFS